MAHEQGSDSDDVYFTEVSKDHLNGIVTKFVHYLTTSRDLSAKIKHVRGKPAEMIFNFGTQSGENG